MILHISYIVPQHDKGACLIEQLVLSSYFASYVLCPVFLMYLDFFDQRRTRSQIVR